MALSPAFLDELRSRTLLSALIGKSVKITRAGREWKACCPFHNEKSPSFTINDDKGFYHCFGCGAHGDAIRWMTDQRGLPFMDAVKELAGAAGLEVPAADPRAAQRAEQALTLRDVVEASAAWFRERLADEEGAPVRDYLAQRGLGRATAEAFGLGYAPDARGRLREVLNKYGDPLAVEAGMLIQPPPDAPKDRQDPYDRFRGRLMIPIRDARGRTIAFGGRILGPGEPKYLNSPDTPLFDKGRILFNLDRAAPAARTANRLIVVEGYMDVIALAQAGIGEAVAPLGTALTEEQLILCWRQIPVPTLAFDGDAAGQRAAERAVERALPILKPGFSLAVLTLPAGQDPDDVVRSEGRDNFDAMVASASPLAPFIFEKQRVKFDLRLPDGRAAFKERLIEKAGSIENPSVSTEYRRWFVERFYGEYGWKKNNISEISQFVHETGRERSRKLFHSVYRSMLFALSQRPIIAFQHIDSFASISIDHKIFMRCKEAIIDHIFDNPEANEDAIQQLSDTIIGRVGVNDIAVDLLFPWNRDKSKIDSLLPNFINFVSQEQDIEREIELIRQKIVDDRELLSYDSLHRRRSQCISRRQDLRSELSNLVSDDLAEDARWAA